MSEFTELTKLKLALSENQPITACAKEDEGGDAGEAGGASGQGGTVIEKRLFVEMFGLLRQNEKEFGIAHDFDAMAYLAKAEANKSPLAGELGQQSGNQLKNHPILSQLQKFDGDTSDMSMDPKQNTDAQERYENQLRHQLGLGMGNRPPITPKPV